MRRLIIHFVRNQAEEIFECRNGAEALPAYRKYLPDWVLMDIEMPEIDGISATRQIIADYPEARVVIVTDHDSAILREAAAKAGARKYINKKSLIELRLLLAS